LPGYYGGQNASGKADATVREIAVRVRVAVELLLVPECPHADTARRLVTRCLDELKLDAAVVERVGEFPSPTILVNGRDVTTGGEVTEGVSACRLDLPTALQVRHALDHAIRPVDGLPAGLPDGADAYPAQLAVGVTRDRLAAVTPAARAVHTAILRQFAATGVAGVAADPLAVAAAGRTDVDGLLAELHDHDVIRLDETGRVVAAYPFSGIPTAHTVRVDGGPTVYAMCAIDALGIADTLGRDTIITSTDPTNGHEIRIERHGPNTVWTPDTAVVVVGSTTPPPLGDGCCPPPGDLAAGVPPAAERCCATMNFFTSTDTARKWLDTRPDVTGVVLGQGQAARLGADIFGHLLDD
jgi:hypothetical protein